MPELNDIAKSLLVVQDEDGMFHILLNLPHDESAPDVSGTGMIAFYMAIAIDHGWLDEKRFSESVLKASNALKQFIGKNGEVYSSSKGPGPLCSEEEYIKYQPEVDEKHGFQGVICGLLSEIILQNH